MEHDNISESPIRTLESQEISDKEHNVIKGDTVGETLYSAKWILNTLISLSKVYEDGWNECIENDLCTLWDMTAEKDIIEFLMENDFFKMAEFTIRTINEPRLTEIIVGIIGNICCETKQLEILGNSDELVSTILSLISSDDKETLIQVLRILRAIVWDIQTNSKSLWLKKIIEYEILGEAISFILKSSTNDELLISTIDFVNLISETQLPNYDNFFEHTFDIDQLIFALCESMLELCNQKDNSYTEVQLTSIENWFNIIFNIMRKGLLKFLDNQNDDNFKKINAVLLKLLQPYENITTLMPLEEKSLYFIQSCVKMIFSFQKNEMIPDLQLIKIILKIMLILKSVNMENEFNDDDPLKQLQDYITNYWIDTLKLMNKEQIIEILRLCNSDIINNILETTNSISGVPEICITKLLRAKSTIF